MKVGDDSVDDCCLESWINIKTRREANMSIVFVDESDGTSLWAFLKF